MAEDAGEKTEAPTPRRRQEARDEGQVARSPDLSAAVLLLGAIVLLRLFGTPLVDALKKVLIDFLSGKSLADASPASAITAAFRALLTVALAMAPMLLGMMVLAVVVNLTQVGFHFTTKRLEPKFDALNPFKGIGKLFSGGQAGVQLLMNLLKLGLVAAVAYSAIHDRLVMIVGAQALSFQQVFVLGAEIIYSIAIRVGVLLLVLAAADYAWQRYRFEKGLRMSKDEIKREMKQMDGDPHIKQRRRQIAMQMAKNRMKQDVPTADVVVTNPTEYAVAIKYDPNTMDAPKVIAKGRGLIAAEIRRIAIAHGVPILERKPLARALFKLVEVGQDVPEQFYAAVAEILAYVYELTGKLRLQQRKAS